LVPRHDCEARPKPTRSDILAALKEVTPKYLAAEPNITEAPKGRFFLAVSPDLQARNRHSKHRIGIPLLARGYYLTTVTDGIYIY
jgi:hypothetical protein